MHIHYCTRHTKYDRVRHIAFTFFFFDDIIGRAAGIIRTRVLRAGGALSILPSLRCLSHVNLYFINGGFVLYILFMLYKLCQVGCVKFCFGGDSEKFQEFCLCAFGALLNPIVCVVVSDICVWWDQVNKEFS